MKDLNYYKQLDRQILEEANVKILSRELIGFSQPMNLKFDGQDYFFEVDGKTVDSLSLRQALPLLLAEIYKK